MTVISVALAWVREGSEPVAAPPLRALGLPKVHPCLKRDRRVLSSLRWCALFSLMADFYDFSEVFGSNPNVAYDEQSRAKIHHNRQLLENELFIDRLLKALGVRKGMLR